MALRAASGLVFFVLLSFLLGCDKGRNEVSKSEYDLVGTWKMDTAVTRDRVIADGVLGTEEALVFLKDEREVVWRVKPEEWTLEIDGRPHVTHAGEFIPNESGGILSGSVIGERPTLIDIQWDEAGKSFWAESKNHSLWPSYREYFIRVE